MYALFLLHNISIIWQLLGIGSHNPLSNEQKWCIFKQSLLFVLNLPLTKVLANILEKSKNQVLQLIYLKHHVCETSLIIMDKKPDEIHKKLNSTKIKQSYTLLIHI